MRWAPFAAPPARPGCVGTVKVPWFLPSGRARPPPDRCGHRLLLQRRELPAIAASSRPPAPGPAPHARRRPCVDRPPPPRSTARVIVADTVRPPSSAARRPRDTAAKPPRCRAATPCSCASPDQEPSRLLHRLHSARIESPARTASPPAGPSADSARATPGGGIEVVRPRPASAARRDQQPVPRPHPPLRLSAVSAGYCCALHHAPPRCQHRLLAGWGEAFVQGYGGVILLGPRSCKRSAPSPAPGPAARASTGSPRTCRSPAKVLKQCAMASAGRAAPCSPAAVQSTSVVAPAPSVAASNSCGGGDPGRCADGRSHPPQIRPSDPHRSGLVQHRRRRTVRLQVEEPRHLALRRTAGTMSHARRSRARTPALRAGSTCRRRSARRTR